MFTTHNPPTVQRMPWPQDDDGSKSYTYDTWILNEDDFSWLEEPEGKPILQSRIVDISISIH